MAKAGPNIRTDYQAIPDKNRPTPDNMGIGGALGGFLLTNSPIIFSMTFLKTITTNAYAHIVPRRGAGAVSRRRGGGYADEQAYLRVIVAKCFWRPVNA
ncbi:MAG: hypothetical protein ABSB11_02940 [Sedimentisphaerales bacterium]